MRAEQDWLWSALAVESGARLQEIADLDAKRDGPLAVQFVQDSGGTAVAKAVAATLTARGEFVAGTSPHLVRAEVLSTWSSCGLRLHLWRRGWDIAAPELWVACPCPWLWTVAFSLSLWFSRIGIVSWIVGAGFLQAAVFLLLGSGQWARQTTADVIRLGFGGWQTTMASLAGDRVVDSWLAVASAVLFIAGAWAARATVQGSFKALSIAVAGPMATVVSILLWLEASVTCGLLAAFREGSLMLSLLALTAACGLVCMSHWQLKSLR